MTWYLVKQRSHFTLLCFVLLCLPAFI